jgi:hypothetical protein
MGVLERDRPRRKSVRGKCNTEGQRDRRQEMNITIWCEMISVSKLKT